MCGGPCGTLDPTRCSERCSANEGCSEPPADIAPNTPVTNLVAMNVVVNSAFRGQAVYIVTQSTMYQ